MFRGRVTAIKHTITVENEKGLVHILEINSLSGLEIGDIAICEEDCGKSIRIGDKVVEVQRLIQ